MSQQPCPVTAPGAGSARGRDAVRDQPAPARPRGSGDAPVGSRRRQCRCPDDATADRGARRGRPAAGPRSRIAQHRSPVVGAVAIVLALFAVPAPDVKGRGGRHGGPCEGEAPHQKWPGGRGCSGEQHEGQGHQDTDPTRGGPARGCTPPGVIRAVRPGRERAALTQRLLDLREDPAFAGRETGPWSIVFTSAPADPWGGWTARLLVRRLCRSGWHHRR